MNATKTVSLTEIRTAVLDCHLASLERGSGWFAVRVNTDGEIYQSLEASRCYSEDEYYDRQPHTVTIWEDYGKGSGMSKEDLESEREAADEDWFELNLPSAELVESLTKAGLELDEDF